jgi:streptogramin lyase
VPRWLTGLFILWNAAVVVGAVAAFGVVLYNGLQNSGEGLFAAFFYMVAIIAFGVMALAGGNAYLVGVWGAVALGRRDTTGARIGAAGVWLLLAVAGIAVLTQAQPWVYLPSPFPSAVLSYPHGLSLDGRGDLLVADTAHRQIVIFGPDGRVQRRIAVNGGDPRYPSYPTAVASDGQGGVYVASYGSDTLQHLDAQGTELQRVDVSPYSGTLRSLTVGRDGTVWLSREGHMPQVLAFDRTLRPVHPWGTRALVSCGREQGPYNLAIGPHDLLGVSDGACADLRIYAADGRLLHTLGHGDFTSPGGPRAMAVDARGAIFVVDDDGGRIVRFDAHGRHLPAWAVSGLAPTTAHTNDPFDSPTLGSPGIVVDHAGNVYLATKDHIVKLGPTGQVLAHWG